MASDKSDEAPTVPEPLRESRVTIDSVLAMDVERYQPLGVLGKGGMGEVQLCKDTRIARDVAMKTLRAKYRDQSGYRERFLFEARLQGQLEHPSIVPVHDLGVSQDGELYFTMKRIRGITLAKALDNVRDGVGTYSRRRLLSAFSNVCLAVDFAHTRGVVHRDLKPHNIMLGDFGEVYILDWGIAKLVDRTDTPLGEVVEVPGADSQTRAGATLGTPPYIAPEREAGQPADARSDVYSLGVILAQIVESDDDIAPELAAIANRASAKDVALRYRSARELHDALERFLDGDRDLEARRKAATEHVARAEQALARKDRTATAREVGRALGLDPSNARALRILMRLLSDTPSELPPAAQEEIDRRWLMRRGRTMRIGAVSTATLLVALPFLLWMGIRNWLWVAAFVVSVLGASTFQWIASQRPRKVWFASSFTMQIIASSMLTSSLGLLGIVPACFTVAIVAWRQTVHETINAVLMLVVVFACMLAPFALIEAGVIPPLYSFAGDGLTIRSLMHELPEVPTLVYLITITMGVVIAASIYSRLFVSEIRRAETQLTFQAWQLQQLIPPESEQLR
jgi:eukaryotic-like serine/threonine-protein kinase